MMTYADGRNFEAKGFDVAVGRGLSGGFDAATFFDTPDNDTLGNSPALRQVNFSNATAGLFLQTLNFDRVSVIANRGGTLDRAFLNDTAGNDFFTGRGTEGSLISGPLNNPTDVLSVSLFDSVSITASAGGANTFNTSSLAYTFATAGPWTAV